MVNAVGRVDELYYIFFQDYAACIYEVIEYRPYFMTSLLKVGPGEWRSGSFMGSPFR